MRPFISIPMPTSHLTFISTSIIVTQPVPKVNEMIVVKQIEPPKKKNYESYLYPIKMILKVHTYIYRKIQSINIRIE